MSFAKPWKKFITWAGVAAAVILIFTVGFLVGKNQLPVQLVSHYSAGMLWEEAATMGECGECHAGRDFHRCETCHDDHGAVEFADLPFYALISFTGDVSRPGFIEVNDVLPYRDQPHTHTPLLDFLAQQGVQDFESVTLTSRDGGLITIPRSELTDRALLLPYADGIRFASEDLHVSTWLKGLTGMIVVGEDRPLTINGEATSVGRLLLNSTRRVTVERATVMYASEVDGKVREAVTASRVVGADVASVLEGDPYEKVYVTDQLGEARSFEMEEIAGAVLTAGRNGTTLVLPGLGRPQWIKQVVDIRTE